ncbi:MarR family transcriptional regulator [Halioxenophilus sp. WMMB6]|uniref:MarR family winged helix-turn-helix transcriptional regulator n=1 Tax=Halioxenophilus sp. WMMB6 TaxID=3073815 RepID=UPI00295E72C7|nr:MarR family transcriptional regulator [Halioxenophilus sp. WMMB6]
MSERKYTNEMLELTAAIVKIRGVLRELYAPASTSVGLTTVEATVLGAVVHGREAMTVSQIGRLLGHPRQAVQRAALNLKEHGYIDFIHNPNHKRAALMVVTDTGRELNQANQAEANAISEKLFEAVDKSRCQKIAAQLRALTDELVNAKNII